MGVEMVSAIHAPQPPLLRHGSRVFSSSGPRVAFSPPSSGDVRLADSVSSVPFGAAAGFIGTCRLDDVEVDARRIDGVYSRAPDGVKDAGSARS